MESNLTFTEQDSKCVVTLYVGGNKPFNEIWIFGHGPTKASARDDMVKDLVEQKKEMLKQISDMEWKIEQLKDKVAAIENWQRDYQGGLESVVTPAKAPEFVDMNLEGTP
jgi:hypothetical protein